MSEPRLEPDELSTLKSLVNSSDWKAYRDLMEEHRDHLNKSALLKLDERDFERAFGLRVRAKEADAQLDLINSRLAELKKEREE